MALGGSGKSARKELPKFHYGIGLAAGGPLFINLEERLIPKNSRPQGEPNSPISA
jgi:hypothetical protein